MHTSLMKLYAHILYTWKAVAWLELQCIVWDPHLHVPSMHQIVSILPLHSVLTQCVFFSGMNCELFEVRKTHKQYSGDLFHTRIRYLRIASFFDT